MRRYFYPRPPRGGRPRVLCTRRHRPAISIHALREEGDPDVRTACTACALFLSTPSARRATLRQRPEHLPLREFLSTPSARRATLCEPRGDVVAVISIHALREEGDLQPHRTEVRLTDFYPRPPRGGRHGPVGTAVVGDAISIHALREEGDRCR